jgi:hypothetical protein
MTENTADTQAKHHTFIKNIVASKTVYSRKNDEGFATAYSNEYEHEDGEPVEIICFGLMLNRTACAKDSWMVYPCRTYTGRLYRKLCAGMYEDELLVGSEFDTNMLGQETEPLEVILQILNEADKTGALEFQQYESANELREIVRTYRRVLKPTATPLPQLKT